MRNVASYAQKPSPKAQMQQFMKDFKTAGVMGAASSAALLHGAAKAAEEASPYIYQTAKNPDIVTFCWGLFGASFTMSIALVVFGRSGL